MKRIFFFPDTHTPYHDRQAWRCAVNACKRFRPHIIVVLGDFFDFYAVSGHRKDPKRQRLLVKELKTARRQIREVSTIPCEKRIFIMGNHEWRLDRYLHDRAPELDGMIDVNKKLGIDKGWEVIPYKKGKQLGKLYITHDLGKAGKGAIQAALVDAGKNVVIGHLHRMGMVYGGSAFGESHVAACFGWLGGRESSSEYKHELAAKRDYHHGFGVGFMRPSGVVHLFAVPIIKGRCALPTEVELI